MAEERIEAPMVGKIISVSVSAGSVVEEGDVLCLLEAMKMENPLISPVAGTVKEVKVSPGQSVKSGELIAIIEY